MGIVESKGRLDFKHRSAASVLAFMFLFAALYTAGVGFFLFVNSNVQSIGKANSNQALVAQQAGLEKLGVAAHLNATGNLFLRINNTGGVSSTILEVYVACNSKCPGGFQQGQLISKAQGSSPPSPYLTTLRDLSVTLPITLPIGTSTRYLSCGVGPTGCDIGIKKGAFTYNGAGEVVVASVLTADGNVFSAQYPPPPLPNKVYTVVSSNSSLTKIQESGGGPLIAVQMVATPSQTYSCTGCVNDTVFVYNYATVTMTGVSVSINPPSVTGTAALNFFSACQPSSTWTDFPNISPPGVGPDFGVAAFKCKYSAATGTVGGFGSFSGTATGTVSGSPVTSAETNSNPIQIGGLANIPGQGAFTGNFFLLKYSTCVQNLTGNYPFFLNGAGAKVVEGQPANNTGLSATTASGESLPSDVAVDSSGNLWVADYNNNRIVEYPGPVYVTGEAASLVIGQPSFTSSAAPNPPTRTSLSGPTGIAFDSSGDLFVADSNNNRVLEFPAPLSTDEIASVVIGQADFIHNLKNQGGAVNSVTLSNPRGLAFDSAGNLWVSDWGNNRITEYRGPSFAIRQAAITVLGQKNMGQGNPNQGKSEGPDTLYGPWGVAFDPLGNLWAADSANNRVLEYVPVLGSFSNGQLASLVLGQVDFFSSSSPSPPSSTSMNDPTGVAVDKVGRVYVLDSNNNRVLGYLPPYSSNQAAFTVLGQPNFVSNGGATTASGLRTHGPGIDGHNSHNCSPPSGATSCAATLTTSNYNDVIFALCGAGFTGTTSQLSTPTDTAGLTWTLRDLGGDAKTNRIAGEYYAVSRSPLSSDSITCHTTVSENIIQVAVFGVNGADLGTIFDQTGSLPNTGLSEGFVAGPASCSMSTSNSNDLLLAFAFNGQTAFTSGPAGFSLVDSATTGIRVDSEGVTSLQSAVSEQDAYGGSARWVMFCDAVSGLASQGIAFDQLGDMWVADGNNNRALFYAKTLTDFKAPCTANASPVTLSNLPSGSFLSAGNDFYTAYYVQVTNSFNTTLPILQYSYLFGDASISGEDFWYLVGSNTSLTNGVYYPNYGTSPPSFVKYPTDCNIVNAQNIPTDSNCFYVSPGKTATLTYAACGWSSVNWAWGGHKDAVGYDKVPNDCNGFSPCLAYYSNALVTSVRGDCVAFNGHNGGLPQGLFMGIVVSYLYKGRILAQVLPFEGQFLLRGTTTSLSCNPPSTSTGVPTTCTATVVDSDGGQMIIPTGNVTFTATPLGSGTFSSTSCTLGVTGECNVTFTPSISQGNVTITATYLGDVSHGSSGPTSLNVPIAVFVTTTVTTTSTTTLTTTATSTSSIITTTVTTTVGSTTTSTSTITSTATSTSTASTTTSGTGTITVPTTTTTTTTGSTTHSTTSTSTSSTTITTSVTHSTTTTVTTTTSTVTSTSTVTTTSTTDTTLSTSFTTSSTSSYSTTTTVTTTTTTTTTTNRPH